jgi:hypothetical protein
MFLEIISFSIAWGEVKVFEREVEETVSRGQSQEQVEAFALQKAKRLAVEEAGTYISSLTVVLNYQLQKDEVTALASGVVQAKIVGVPAVHVEKGVIYVKVKARIDVDTSVLDRQIQEIMKEKGTLKKLEEERKKNKDLEEKLASLKSSEVKRLEELNTQALALERERDRQRLFREEQSLKAKGELSKAEVERLTKEREMQDRINKTLVEQERAKREEITALAAEQDRIRRAQLENEQRWSDLARKAQLAQDQWAVIDDTLSLKQAMIEVSDLKKEIANLKLRFDYQYGENVGNLKAAYAQQLTLTKAKLPPSPATKDGFETTAEYNRRIEDYDRQVKKAEAENEVAVGKLKKEENLKLAEAKVAYLGQQITVLEPFVKRLQDLQDRKFILPEGAAMTLELGEPDADNNRFPLRLQYNGKSWSTWWDYTDRNIARDFYRTKTYLKAEGLFQIEEAAKLIPKLTTARVTHPGMKETREFRLETPRIFSEIDQFGKLKKAEATAREGSKIAACLLTHLEIGKDDDLFIACGDEIVIDTQHNLMWAAKDNGADINWHNAISYCENYRGAGLTGWRMPTQDELAGLYNGRVKGNNGFHLTSLITLSRPSVWASETHNSGVPYFIFEDGVRARMPNASYTYGLRALPVRAGR